MVSKIRLLLLVLTGAASLYLSLVWSPPEASLGNSVRILYFHVPAAWISVFAFAISALCAALYLAKKNEQYAARSHASALIGFACVLTATASGAVWAKIAWGSAWNWDVREVSIVFLLMIYAAYFALHAGINPSFPKQRFASVYLIASALTVPFFVFIMPRLTESLHPEMFNADASHRAVALLPEMRVSLVVSILFFTLMYFEILQRLTRAIAVKHKNGT